MSTLVLLRHGQSTWNAEGRFTGWADLDLSLLGEDEAAAAGDLLRAEPTLGPDVVHTSVLTRAVRTANLALDQMGRSWLPVRRHWRLNERHYGALEGLDKKETAARHGAEQIKIWRRSWAIPPPLLEPGDPRHPSHDPRYAGVAPDLLPGGEALADVVARMLPYWHDAIVPDLMAGRRVLVVAHGNSLRGLVKHLDRISDEDIPELDIPTGIPLVYELDRSLRPLRSEYLGDPQAAEAAAEAVARQAG
ncbi:MAG: 2,3-diphosphoglycerate-dependent phosphoglycerate mutase [Acidimicrobiales bacterium]|nr:MAG: 2,3-diphosphoglycerate-dependent phosphoglycerate mutase [Acidimicrobiales bacterium]